MAQLHQCVRKPQGVAKQISSPTFPEIAAELNARVKDLARALLGEPNRTLSSRGQHRHGRNGSLAIEISGLEAGRWYDHENGVGGDAIELIRRQRDLWLKVARVVRGSGITGRATHKRREAQ